MTKSRSTFAAALIAVLAYAPVSQAIQIQEDTLEVNGHLDLAFINAYGPNLNADIGMGYYILNGVMLGGRLELAAMRDYTMFAVFATIEQNIDIAENTPFIPYFGADLGGAIVSLEEYGWGQGGQYTYPDVNKQNENSGTRAAFVGVFRVGFKFVLTDNASIDTSLSFALASDRIYARRENDPVSGNVTLRMGLRYCLW